MILLRTFGTLALENGGRPLTGAAAQPSRLALLAVLAAAGDRGMSRDSLLAIFWPESDLELARGSLKQALYTLRRDLGEREVTSGSTHLGLNPSVIESDVGEFNRAVGAGALERAVALHRGKFLDGVHLAGGGFERWLDLERQRLEALYQGALAQLAQTAADHADHRQAVRWWRALALADPLSASVASSLMRSLVAIGDRPAALRHAKIHEALVRSELDAAPERSMLELVAQIRSDPAAGPEAEVSSLPAHPVDAAPSQPVPLGVGPGRRSRWLAFGVGALGVAVAIWAIAAARGSRRLDPNRVVLTVTGAAPAGRVLDSLLLGELVSGLAERDPSLHVVVAKPDSRSARARYVIAVRALVEGDSVRFTADATDATAGASLGPIEPVVTATSATAAGIRTLRDRIAVALAAQRNPLFASWAHAAALPRSWESFQQLAAGIKAWTGGGTGVARSHFRTAASLDSTSATPLLWEAFVTEENQAFLMSDSILALAARGGRRSGPWELALIKVLKARNRRDLAGAHAAGHELLKVVPGSEWALLVAWDAIALGRAREAVELTARLNPDQGWAREWSFAWIIRDVAHHFLGDYRGELEVARAALLRDPDSRLYLQLKAKALAGLGRVSEVTEVCNRAMSLRAEPRTLDWQPCTQSYLELWAHGHQAAARSLAERLLASRELGMPISPKQRALDRAGVYEDLAEWLEVERVLGTVATSDTADPEYLRLLSLVQAFRRDTIGLGQTSRRIDSVASAAGMTTAPDPFQHAGITALLGDRDGAVALIAQAFREGYRFRIALHWAGPFEGLRRYPPFEALARPVEDPAHLTQITRR